jgi:NAD(P)-dependent dehydrogenase (short-subunit alcohol dehydrogenase family)
MRLQGRRALVTGAGQGIGAAVARRFAAEGAKVAVVDVEATNADKVANAIPGAIAIAGDVSSHESVTAMFDRVDQAFGGLDILVHCAAILKTGDLLATTLDSWDRMVAVNLTGTFLCMSEAARRMEGSEAPNMVIFASSSGDKANRNYAAYGATKAGVTQLIRCSAMDLSSRGIRVNGIAPGPIATPMRPPSTPESEAAIRKVVPLGRLGEPDEVANAVLFLASNEASYVTGEIIYVDGGITPAGVI